MTFSKPTKSFFNQDHNNKPRPPQWHRAQNRVPLSETSSNVPPTKPPIPATSQAKSKLKAFQFIAGRPDENQLNEGVKESVAKDENVKLRDAEEGNSNDAAELIEQPVSSAKAGDAVEFDTPQLPHANTFPCTPGTRLPLEDLIGNIDENAKRIEPNETPEEHIGWIPNSSSALLTPNRKRKRARSSSPSCPNTSSQKQETSIFFAGGAEQADKKTPDADPAANLWQRYATGKQTDGTTNLPDFGHLIQFSPRALETPAKSASLRRWASTGNDWPSSKCKRQRTNGKTTNTIFKNGQTGESGMKSKVATMVDRLQESLASQKHANPKPAVRVEGPSSSSPLPEAGAGDSFESVPTASPLQAKHPMAAPDSERLHMPNDMSKSGTATSNKTNHEAGTNPVSNRQGHQPDSVISAPLHLQCKAPLPAYKRPSITRTPSTDIQQPLPKPAPATLSAALGVDLDEFGDDLDLTAEDLEDIMVQPPPLHQRSLHQIPLHPDPPLQEHLNLESHHLAAALTGASGQANRPIRINDLDDEDDEFGDNDIDEASLAQAESSATQAFRISPRKRSPRKSTSPKKSRSPKKSSQVTSSNDIMSASRPLHRYVVKQMVDAEYTNAKGRRCTEKVLVAEDERTSLPTAVKIRDSWTATSISVGNIIHLAHLRQPDQYELPPHPPGQVTISDSEDSAFLIVHPDHMLSATTVADSFDCIRKAVLQDRIKATSEANKPMVYGKILHEIFQQALSANRWDDAFLAALVEQTVQNHLEGLWELGMGDTVLAVEEMKAKMGELAAWARIFVAESPSDAALVDDKQGEKVWMSISKLIAIEEHIWSPQYGLKGNIDATVQATLVDHPKEPGKRLIIPFEVKTGRTTQSPAHRAQTALYTLLLSDRYDAAVKAGVLYYLESSAMSRIAPSVNEMRQMVQQRNRLASYIHRAKNPSRESQLRKAKMQSQEIEESGFPALLKNPFKCGKCYARQSCFAYHALVENGSATSAGMVDDGKKNHGAVWQEAVGHLQLTSKDLTQTDSLKRWFAKWDRLLTFEESELSRFRKELWTMGSTEREAAGRCFGNLVISQDSTSTAASMASSDVDGIEGGGGKINRFAYVFVRSSPLKGLPFNEGSQLTVGEPIVVSSENGQWALANGYVIAGTKRHITVAVDRRLGDARRRQSNFDMDFNQSFKGIMTVGDDTSHPPPSSNSPTLYRLDKDEFSNGLALVRSNLVNLMSSHPIHTKLRKQLIFSGEPTFTSSSSASQLPPSQLGEMNEDQCAAVKKVLGAQDYALILGMPGTGKTTTIAHIIRALLVEGKSILLSSFTHTAVDNILLKIRDIVPPNSVLRLGVPSKINARVQEFCQLAATPRGSIDGIDTCYMHSQIVATTCMGTNHALFNRRAFDVCIVDEASQITLPTSLGPLLHARKFVLVGDHYQLPPLVQNKAALEGGLDVSLFRQLSEEHPEAIATLGKQYRMCEDIMSLSNALIYDGQLRCGTAEVARRMLQVSDLAAIEVFHSPTHLCSTPSRGGKCWLSDLCRPERKVVFANTDNAGKAAAETLTSGKNITNELEATLTAQLVLSLLAVGVPGNEIGVITLYRSQLALMRRMFKIAGISSDVEIDSADRFQGRDKECIILSVVRSNESGIVGDLLKDWRRVNVALTRARSKLIVVGSRRTLQHNELLEKLLALVDQRGWVLDLPKDADSCHSFNFSSQAASGVVSKSMTSPTKKLCDHSPRKHAPKATPTKTAMGGSSSVLRESPSAGNRNISGLKTSGKVITGRNGSIKAKLLDQAAFQIFEDLTADEI